MDILECFTSVQHEVLERSCLSIQSVMDYDFASISTVDKDLKEFLESPTQEKNLALLFQPVPANHTVYMCLIQRRYEGWLKSEYFDLYLQLGR